MASKTPAKTAVPAKKPPAPPASSNEPDPAASAKPTSGSGKAAAAKKAPPSKAASKASADAPVKPVAKAAGSAKKTPPPKKTAPVKTTPSEEVPSADAAQAAAAPAAEVTPAPEPAKPAAAKPAAKKAEKAPAKPVSPFDAKFLEIQRKRLEEERIELVGSANRLQEEADSLMQDLDPGDVQFDDESGEGDSLVVERERDLALSAQARQMVTEIDAALIRIEAGTYGLSTQSGKPIPKARLEAIPWATELVEEKVGGLGRR